MILAATHSHLGGLEIMGKQRPGIWEQIQEVVAGLEAEKARQKILKRKGELLGRLIYDHHHLAKNLGQRFQDRGWRETILDYWSAQDSRALAASLALPPGDRQAYLQKSGQTPVAGSVGGLISQGVGLEASFAKPPLVAQDLWLKFPALHRAGLIQVGVEILPMAAWQAQMVGGLATYEDMIFHLLGQGSGHPPTPLVIIGLLP